MSTKSQHLTKNSKRPLAGELGFRATIQKRSYTKPKEENKAQTKIF